MSTATETPAVIGSWVLDQTHSSVGFTVLYMGAAPFQGFFEMKPLPLVDLLLLCGVVAIWAMGLRYVWRNHIIEKLVTPDPEVS